MAESWQEILYQVQERVATITLNRPEKLNAWTVVMARELREALTAAQADEGVRAIIITGAGRGFCSGADMSRLAAAAAGKSTLGAPQAPTEGIEANFAQRLSYLLAVNKPILAAINGPVRRRRSRPHVLLRHALHGSRWQTDHCVCQARPHRRARHRLALASPHWSHERARSALYRALGGGRGGGEDGPGARAAGGGLPRSRASARRRHRQSILAALHADHQEAGV